MVRGAKFVTEECQVRARVLALSCLQKYFKLPKFKNMPKKGCRFVDRCPAAMPECKKMTPILAEVEDGHDVACLLYKSSQPVEGVK